ncbi:MAG: ABC transporter permease [Pseudomonadota bacterium]
MEVLGDIFNISLLAATIRTTVPILLVALGGAFTTKAGIFNIGLEGMMLVSAFFAVLGSMYFGSAIMGVMAGMIAGMLTATLFALLVVTFRANEVVVGLAINILASGMTIALMNAIFGTRGSIISRDIVGLPPVHVPGASALGQVAQVFSGFTPLVYVAFLLVPVLVIFFGRTRLGLYIRVAGEKPEAAEALGISVARLQYIAALFCGALAGLAGAHLSLGYITMFTENMSSGRGFMAVAVLIFSNGDPLLVLAGCLLFGFSDALAVRLQTFDIPSYVVQTVPYLVTIAFLFAFAYRSRPRVFREIFDKVRPASGP